MHRSSLATRPAAVTSSGIAEIGSAASGGETSAFVENERAVRFVVGEELARGGMGRIVRAYDERHRRAVAIKFLLGRGAGMAERFAREARITAALQHPAIVAVYESGESASGEPFYAMKLVEGGSLADAVSARTSFDERLGLLPHLVAATEALSYAHARRVIHRDLKPANVLVGAFGETVVIDWGLAKELDSSARDEPPDDGAPAAELTSAGRALGTPRYMPPEQARGEEADERSDVYALGALLYHLLAGVAPYADVPAEAAVARTIAGPPRALEGVEPRVPPDLAAIVAKAMAREPGDRYGNAGEMAADLRRFGSGQLVRAHSYSLRALLWRWASRHARVLGVGAFFGVVLVAVAASSVRRIVRERDRADVASVTALKERRAMATQRDAAEKLVAFAITSLRERLEKVGRLDVLAGIGKEVDAYYQAVAPLGEGADEGVLDRRASALETLAAVAAAEHDAAEARALFDGAASLRREAASRFPGDATAAAEGALLARRARFEVAESSIPAASAPAERAIAIGDALVTRAPDGAAGLRVAAEGHLALGLTRTTEGKVDEAAAEASRATAIARHLVEVEGQTPEALGELAAALDLVGKTDQQASRFDSKALDESVALREALLARDPANTLDALALSRTCELRAFCRRDGGHTALALADATRTEELRTKLVASDPENTEWLRLLGQAYDTLASVQQLAGRSDAAIESCRKGVAILEAVAAKTPEAPAVHDNLALVYQRLGWILERVGRLTEARAALEASLPIAEHFATAGHGERAVSRLADTYGMLSDVAILQGDRAGARVSVQKVLALLEPAAAHGGSFETQRTVIYAKLSLADLDDELGRRDEARDLRVAALERLLQIPLDQNEESSVTILAKACVALLPSADPHVVETVKRAIAVLEPLHIEGESPRARLAAIAQAKRLLPR